MIPSNDAAVSIKSKTKVLFLSLKEEWKKSWTVFLILSIKDLLIGKSASLEAEAAIRKATMRVKEVKNVLDLKTMHIGSEKLLVNMEVHLTNNLTTDQIEKLVDKIKENIAKEVPAVKHIQVELEAPSK